MAVLVAGLSACGGEEDGSPSAQASESSTPAASASSAPPTEEPAETSETSEPGQGDSGGASGELTPPGTELKLGETATVSFKSGDKTATLAITVTEIEQGEKADLTEYGDQAEGMVPYFITFEVENVDGADLAYNLISVRAITEDGRGTGVIISGEVDGKCERTVPGEEFASAGASFETCELEASREGQEVIGVEYTSGDDYVTDPVVWKK